VFNPWDQKAILAKFKSALFLATTNQARKGGVREAESAGERERAAAARLSTERPSTIGLDNQTSGLGPHCAPAQ
jgi:hypothetical protein